jgi:adenylyltransferase/sulfurtransferase
LPCGAKKNNDLRRNTAIFQKISVPSFVMIDLGPEEKRRYSRQLSVPQIGDSGQRKLKAARIFLAGLGGLGSITAYQLTAAGVGSLRMVDRDTVALDNLNRQILYGTPDVGTIKTDIAADKLSKFNPNVNLEPVHTSITAHNVLDLVSGCDIIVDATDNLAARLTLNRVALTCSIPLIFGGIEGLDGMVTTVLPGQTACLACIFKAEMDSLKEKPVVGPLPGLVASIQALEAIKWIVGAGGLLANRLLRIKGGDWTIKTTRLEKNPACPVCGQTGDAHTE